MSNSAKKDFPALDDQTLDAASGGWSLGGYFSGSVSGFGVSKGFTVDTSGNVYTTTGTGPTFPGIGVSAGGFYSNGTPQDHFAGDGLSTTIGAGKAGVEVGTSASGQNIGVSLGLGVSPVNSADTHSEQAGSVSDYIGHGTPDPTAYDAMGNYTGVGTGDAQPQAGASPEASPAMPETPSAPDQSYEPTGFGGNETGSEGGSSFGNDFGDGSYDNSGASDFA